MTSVSTVDASSLVSTAVEQSAARALEFGDDLTPSQPASAVASATSTRLGFLEGATFFDMEVGTEAIYMIDKRNHKAKSKLKSIRGKAIADIGAKVLRNWAVSLGIQMKKGFNKLDVVRCLLTTKAFHERGSQSISPQYQCRQQFGS